MKTLIALFTLILFTFSCDSNLDYSDKPGYDMGKEIAEIIISSRTQDRSEDSQDPAITFNRDDAITMLKIINDEMIIDEKVFPKEFTINQLRV
ncbi:hypothetical protein PQO03_02760 [Lentisphaera profundi]|uniref:SLH domain-containing protein n=1 Tax=Lentisphaera profundi TaxID=1658616 RepID=A0ABY7VUJ5_9BACT|nr:hypothetical protein [Lentisphaera profundi]WDE96880.1 hypothetical protein PQO03_02760 [Lentisphaera profundi]